MPWPHGLRDVDIYVYQAKPLMPMIHVTIIYVHALIHMYIICYVYYFSLLNGLDSTMFTEEIIMVVAYNYS